MGVYLGSIILSAITIAFVVLTKRRFEECLPVAAISSISFLYLFGVLGVLRVSVPALAVVAVVSLAASVFFTVKQKNTSEILSRCFTPGFFLFACFVLVMPLLCAPLKPYTWDEYSHWLLATKDMYLFDAMPYRQGSYVTMNNYPPFLTLLEYFFMKCNGTYAEPMFYAAHNIMGVIFLMPLTRRLNRKQWYYLAPLAVVIAGIPLFIFPNYWFETGADYLLAISVSYAITAYFCDKKKDLFSVFASCLGISFVIMVKNVGLILAMIPVCLLLLDYLIVQRKDARIRAAKFSKRIACVLLCLVLAFGAKGIYEAVLVKHGITSMEMRVVSRLIDLVKPPEESAADAVPAMEERAADPTNAVQTVVLHAKPVETVQQSAILMEEEDTHLGGLLKDYQFDGFEAFFRFWHFDVMIRFGSVSVSYWFLYVLLMAAGLWLIAKFRSSEDSRSIQVCIGGLLIGFWVYAVISMIGILFGFNASQAEDLMGFDRYIASLYLPMVIVYVSLILQHIEEKNLLLGILGAFCFVLSAVSPRDVLYQALGHISGYADRFDETVVVETLDGLDSETDKVAFVSQGDAGHHLNCTRYYAVPLRINACIGWSFVQDPADAGDTSTAATPQQWAQALTEQGYTHVYLYNPDTYFEEAFAPLFAEPGDIQENMLFEIEQTDGSMQLVTVEN